MVCASIIELAFLTGILVLVSVHSGGAEPQNPFAPPPERKDKREAVVTLSNNKVLQGKVYLTRGKKLLVKCLQKDRLISVGLEELKSFTMTIEWEKEAKEWFFKEGGSDEKIYTGQVRIDRRYQITVVRADGSSITGYVKGCPLYLESGDKCYKFFLHKDQRGEAGQKAEEMVYVKSVVFDVQDAGKEKGSAKAAPAMAPPEEPAGR